MSRSTAILAAVLAACTLPAPEAEDTASASVALSDVPLDVQCLQILVAAGGRSFAPLFDVSPGASASLTVAALPPGPATFSARAYAGACAGWTAAAAPTWVADAVSVTLVASTATGVALVMRRPDVTASAQVTIAFPDEARARLSVGWQGACAVRDDGAAACWGQYIWAVPYPMNPATAISGAAGAVAVGAGAFHGCALRQDGTVVCWGNGGAGQLGNGQRPSAVATAVGVVNLSNVAALASSDNANCALRADGTVACWGGGDYGELGPGSPGAVSAVPVEVPLPRPATQLTGGHFHFCALASDATVLCWGFGRTGALGNGQTADSATPVQVSGIADATSVAAFDHTTCALHRGGTVSCWGEGRFGELGSGTTSASAVPVAVGGLTGVYSLGGGSRGDGPCVVKLDGTAACWGRNGDGQVGNGAQQTSVNSPAAVGGLTGVRAVHRGDGAACALLRDRTVWCWGTNGHGVLGTSNASQSSLVPVRVSGLP